MPREADRPDIEVGARVKAKKLRVNGGETRRDYQRTWHSEARVSVRLAEEVRKTQGRNES